MFRPKLSFNYLILALLAFNGILESTRICNPSAAFVTGIEV